MNGSWLCVEAALTLKGSDWVSSCGRRGLAYLGIRSAHLLPVPNVIIWFHRQAWRASRAAILHGQTPLYWQSWRLLHRSVVCVNAVGTGWRAQVKPASDPCPPNLTFILLPPQCAPRATILSHYGHDRISQWLSSALAPSPPFRPPFWLDVLLLDTLIFESGPKLLSKNRTANLVLASMVWPSGAARQDWHGRVWNGRCPGRPRETPGS